MNIPWNALAGGILLGLSATILLLVKGKIAGISGIVSGLFTEKHHNGWRWLFIVGLIAGGYLMNLGISNGSSIIPIQYKNGLGWMIVAGLFVGIGTKLGNGCTSGHGICGMGRFSVRSVAATCTFMSVAALVVFIRLHLL
ncbi:YeeE/YedE family protein [Vibrio rumoiensis]|uniref:Sulphur transport domain-containing protein n=1 Tax=Vibrio rumoiensis 1S-45 TaxID=1188252 RepID=A0A1E5E4D7_9VIBR|nr:YeeE/YedE family protein [Vibrio rumoiensis]OEF27624.1 hypothetical protein A1QC_06215 [Vibrio rumoiensis 1S-45]